MRNLTLIIPAKNESDSLPAVLNEIKDYECKIIIIVEPSDFKTIKSCKNFNCKIIYQSKKGYGNAIIEGMKKVDTEFLCIFNADGSFDPKDLNKMLRECEKNLDFIFASRYLKNGGSDDDTLVTALGNFIFTKIGNIFFSIQLTDILYTFLLGKTKSFESLDLKCNDFSLCVEIPIKASRAGMNLIDIPSHERKRIAGEKKVNEFRDGFKILLYMLKSFFRLVN